MEQAGGEDSRVVPTEPAQVPQPDQSVLEEGLSIYVDQEEVTETLEASSGKKDYSINKLIKTYKKSSDATRKINKIKNKIKNYKNKENKIKKK